MRIGVFGGTFDPVHHGHLRLAVAARRKARLDRVFFVPAYRSPWKSDRPAAARHRLAMLKLALRGRPGLRVSDWELRRRRPVYTVKTLEHFRRRYPRAALFFIAGGDAMKTRSHWKSPGRLTQLAEWISLRRFPPYAARRIRARLLRGAPVEGLVPPVVARYIRTHGLYRA